MELKWIEDLVALAESGSLTEAAERRNITQPAFTRRIKVIERWLGTEVIDRSRKPARARGIITQRIDGLKALATDLKRLRQDVLDEEDTPRRIVVAAQHALTTGYLPGILARLQGNYQNLSFRLRSANRDECYGLLMTRQAHLMVAYETDRLPVAGDETLIERLRLGDDRLVPVARPGPIAREVIGRESAATRREPLRIITYPREVFFGAILHEELLPPLRERFQLVTVCETALVPGVLQLALSGVGIAWVPLRLAEQSIASGALVELGDSLGRRQLRMVVARLRTPRSRIADNLWSHLALSAER